MNDIMKSASKLAFLTLVGSTCIAFLYLIIAGKITLDPKDFMALVFAAAGYYFGYKGNTNDPMNPSAGK